MDPQIAQKIITEVSRFSGNKYAVTNKYGEVLAKSPEFSIEHNPLDIKSKRAFYLVHDNRKVGFLFIDENLAVVKEIGPILKSMAELILSQHYYNTILTTDEKRIDQLIYEYLRMEGDNKKEIKQALLPFNIDLSKKRIAILFEISDNNYLYLSQKDAFVGERERKIALVKKEIKFFLDSFYTHHRENIISYLGGNDFVILKDMGEDAEEYQTEFRKTLNSLLVNLRGELRTEVTVGVGAYKSGAQGLKESFDQAQTALKFGKQNWGPGQIYHFDSFGVVAPLFSGVTKKNITFSKNIVGTLEKHPELMDSLKAYFANDISLSRTAKKLKIHRNTLVYRLEKIAELTNLDPRVFNEAFQLQIALILDSYSRSEDAKI